MLGRFSVQKKIKKDKASAMKNAKIGFPTSRPHVFVQLKHNNRHNAPLSRISGVKEKKKEKVVADKPTKSATIAYPRTPAESQEKTSPNPILGRFSSDNDKKKEITAAQKHLQTVTSASPHISVDIKHNDRPCSEFDLSSLGGALHFQKSRLGKYILQDSLVNGRITYFNQEKKQYLFWINKNDGYWMVRNPFLLYCCTSNIMI